MNRILPFTQKCLSPKPKKSIIEYFGSILFHIFVLVISWLQMCFSRCAKSTFWEVHWKSKFKYLDFISIKKHYKFEAICTFFFVYFCSYSCELINSIIGHSINIAILWSQFEIFQMSTEMEELSALDLSSSNRGIIADSFFFFAHNKGGGGSHKIQNHFNNNCQT